MQVWSWKQISGSVPQNQCVPFAHWLTRRASSHQSKSNHNGTSHLSDITGRISHFAIEKRQFCKTVSCFWPNTPHSERMTSLVISMSQYDMSSIANHSISLAISDKWLSAASYRLWNRKVTFAYHRYDFFRCFHNLRKLLKTFLES